MGTRATYRLIEQHKDDVLGVRNNYYCLVYGHYDGYPSGVPFDIAEFITKGQDGTSPLVFNGAGCLFANIIWKLKDGKHSYFYLHPMDSRGKSWEDYLYDIIVTPEGIVKIACYTNGEYSQDLIFFGTAEEFITKYSQE